MSELRLNLSASRRYLSSVRALSSVTNRSRPGIAQSCPNLCLTNFRALCIISHRPLLVFKAAPTCPVNFDSQTFIIIQRARQSFLFLSTSTPRGEGWCEGEQFQSASESTLRNKGERIYVLSMVVYFLHPCACAADYAKKHRLLKLTDGVHLSLCASAPLSKGKRQAFVKSD